MGNLQLGRRSFLSLGAGVAATTVIRPRSQSSPFTVTAPGAYRQVRRYERVNTRASTLRFAAPRGGSHSQQLMIRTGSGRARATVELKLTADGVTGTVYEQHYIRVTKPTAPRLFPAGWYPDALLPLEPDRVLQIGADRDTGIWITVQVSPEAPAGSYRGEVAITGVGAGTLTVPVRLEVLDFAIERAGLAPTAGLIWGSQVAAAHGVEVGSPAYWRLMKAYYDLQLDYWFTPSDLPIPTDDPRRWAREAQAYFDDPRVTSIRLPHFQIDADRLDVEGTRPFVEAAQRSGNAEKAYFYLHDMIDEPKPERYGYVRTVSRQLKELAPTIPHLVTTSPKPELDEAVDVWAAEIQTLDAEVVSWAHERDEKLWWYPTLNTRAPYPTPFVDSGLSGARLLPRMTDALKLDGILNWATNYYTKYPDNAPRNVWRDPMAAPPSNGDGYMLYPGKDGPIGTVRLDAFRRGQQDVAELNVFRQRAASVAAELRYPYDVESTLARTAAVLFRAPDDVTHDPDLIEEIRRQQLSEIQSLGRSPRLLVEVTATSSGMLVTAITERGAVVTINGARPVEDRRIGHSRFRFPITGRGQTQLVVTASRNGASVTTRRIVASAPGGGRVLLEFRNSNDLARLQPNDVRARLDSRGGAQLTYAANAEFPNIRIRSTDLGGQDWTAAEAIELDVYNPGTVLASFRVKVYGHDGTADDLRQFAIRPGRERSVRVIPELLELNPRQIESLEVWLWQPAEPTPLTLRRIRWVGR